VTQPRHTLAPSRLDRIFGPVPDLPRPRALGAERRAEIVLWSAAVLLVLLVFRAGFSQPGDLNPAWRGWTDLSLNGRLYWASWGFVFYLLIPVLIVLVWFRESPARYGLRLYITRRTLLLYLVLAAVMIPALFWASERPSFLVRYPFVRDLDGRRDILVWETIYLGRFVALEFFFRGFLLFGLEERFGRLAIPVSVIPYAILHFAKPFPEAMGSIVAGGVLGLVALRTRSIFGGALVHITIALSMDLLAMWRKGILP